MLMEAQLDLLSNDDWDALMGFEVDTDEIRAIKRR